MYLVVSEKGFYLGMSREDTAQKTRYLKKKQDDVIYVEDYNCAVRLIQSVKKIESEQIRVGELFFWPMERRITYIDMKMHCHFLFQERHDVRVKLVSQKSLSYKNCPEKVFDSFKTVKIGKKIGYLLFYDFDNDQLLKWDPITGVCCKVEQR